MKKIIIYTTRFCGYCNAAKKWLEQKGLEYQEIRLYEGNEMDKFREAYPELRTSPQIFCDGKISGDSPTWSNVTPRIFNESDKTWKYLFWHPPSEFDGDHDPKRTSGD